MTLAQALRIPHASYGPCNACEKICDLADGLCAPCSELRPDFVAAMVRNRAIRTEYHEKLSQGWPAHTLFDHLCQKNALSSRMMKYILFGK